MNISLQSGSKFVLRFDPGEEVLKGIEDFATSKGFGAGAFYGIGSCKETELGYFNPNLKEYRKKPFYEDLEIISLQGNLATLSGKTAVHAHGMFGRTDFTTIGGHVFRITTLATAEIYFESLEGALERVQNSDFNLNLLI